MKFHIKTAQIIFTCGRAFQFALFLFCACVLAQSPNHIAFGAQGDNKEKPKKLTQEDKHRLVITSILEQIKEMRNATPPDYKGMVVQYMALFEIFPKQESGKMAIWEAFEISREQNDYTQATAGLATIMGVYGYNETMANPLDENLPVHIRATARIELARLYATQGDLLTALSISRSVPNQYKGVIVGRFSGDQTYYGKVEVIAGLDSAHYAFVTGNFNQAMLLLLELIRAQHGQEVGRIYGKRNAEVEAIEIADKVIQKMPASESKRIAMYQELADTATDRLTLGLLPFFRANQYIRTFKEQGNLQRIQDAQNEYHRVLNDFSDVINPTIQGEMPLCVLAVDRIRLLLVETAKRPKEAVAELYRLEDSYKDSKNSKMISAYCRYHAAMIAYKNLQNYQQAIYDLEVLLEQYPGVLDYPSPQKEKIKPTLAQRVKKVLPKIHEKNVNLN